MGVQRSLVSNEVPTANFKVWRGVSQRRPPPPVLFILVLDPLLRRAVALPIKRGFPLNGNSSVEISAYAGDISLFVRDRDRIATFQGLFASYGKLSVAKLNASNYAALHFGGVAD